jgi:hypothetical protein
MRKYLYSALAGVALLAQVAFRPRTQPSRSASILACRSLRPYTHVPIIRHRFTTRLP